MKQKRVWYLGLGILLAVWMIASLVIAYARAQKMTSEKILDYIRNHPLKGNSEIDRHQIIEGLANRMNHLAFEDRQRFRFEKSTREFYREMTDAERTLYLEKTLPTGMKQMVDAFNKMKPEQRKKLVNRALAEMEKAQENMSREDMERALNDQNTRKVIEQGLKSYMTDADASAKLDIQPLMEQMQNMMRMMK